jgi:hypothetical protein
MERRTSNRERRTGLATLLSCLCFAAVTATAQYGHPLKGSWSGDWGTTKDKRIRILLDLHWDGKTVTGTINPGRDEVPLRKASLDPANWRVSFEAEGKDSAGGAVRYVIEGKLENLGSYYRVITGTWTQGGQKGDFRITRN